VYFAIVVFIDYAQQSVWLRQKLPGQAKAPMQREDPKNLRSLRDDDVVNEENRVAAMSQNLQAKRDTAVYIKNVRKVFHTTEEVKDDAADCRCCHVKCGACCSLPCCACMPCAPAKRDIYAVRDVSMAVPRGEVLGLLGANGAGKTTTFRMMCGVEVFSFDFSAERVSNCELETAPAFIFGLLGFFSGLRASSFIEEVPIQGSLERGRH